jgi:hypothetical protein
MVVVNKSFTECGVQEKPRLYGAFFQSRAQMLQVYGAKYFRIINPVVKDKSTKAKKEYEHENAEGFNSTF